MNFLITPFCPAWNVNYPAYPLYICYPPIGYLVPASVMRRDIANTPEHTNECKPIHVTFIYNILFLPYCSSILLCLIYKLASTINKRLLWNFCSKCQIFVLEVVLVIFFSFILLWDWSISSGTYQEMK